MPGFLLLFIKKGTFTEGRASEFRHFDTCTHSNHFAQKNKLQKSKLMWSADANLFCGDWLSFFLTRSLFCFKYTMTSSSEF